MKRMVLLLFLCVCLGPALFAGQSQKEKERERDKPRAPKPQAEIMLRLIEASSDPAAANDALALIPAELHKLLTFTRYRLLDSGYIRGVEDENLSLALGGTLRGELRFKVRSGSAIPEIEYEVEIEGPRPEKGSAARLLGTTAIGKSGETIVLGASRMREASKALIVLLTGKLLP